MNKRFVIRYFSILVAILFVILVIVSVRKAQLYPSPTSLEECNTLEFNGEDKESIVFFSDKRTSEKYVNTFLQTKPFSENKYAFNFYYIEDYKPRCEIYQDIAIFCYSKDLIKKASSCPNDYIVAVGNFNDEIRSSSFMNVMSLNVNHPLSVLMHEFGHSFVSLAEEYAPAELFPGARNCVGNCSEFLGINEGCFLECSRGGYFRSIDNGLMRSLSSKTYGKFDESLINAKIRDTKSRISGRAIEIESYCSQQKYYLVEGIYNNGEISILSKSIEKGCVGGNGNGEFGYEVISNNGEVVNSGNFSLIVYTDVQLAGSSVLEGETSVYKDYFSIKLPYSTSAQLMRIVKDNQILEEERLNDLGARACRIE